jgi:hypothetical protein
MALSNWPTIVDDDGSLIVGTIYNKAIFDAIRASIEDDLFSATNPTVTAEDIIDEVVTARGSKTTLDARLDVALNDDGTLKTAASLVTATQAASLIGMPDLARNQDMMNWAAGVAAAPTGFALSGTGAAVAKCGTGLGDTTNVNAGPYCAKLTYGSATAILTQQVLLSQEVTDFTSFKGKTIAVGVRCKATVANQASIVVDDGVGTTRGGSTGNATYHSGNSTVQWLYCTHTINSAATKLEVSFQVASAGAAYFGGLMIVISDIAIDEHMSHTTPPREFYARVLTADPADYKQATPANDGDTGWSYVVPGGLLRTNGDMLRITVNVDTVGSNNQIVEFKFKFGGATASPWRLSGDAGKSDGVVMFTVWRITATTQWISAHGAFSYTGIVNNLPRIAGTETLANDITIKTQHGASSSGTDYAMQRGITVEYVPCPF